MVSGIFLGGLHDQKYFYNTVVSKAFCLFLLSSCKGVQFSRGHMTCDTATDQMQK